MVSKKRAGKIQLTIGIIFLVIGIAGFIYCISFLNNLSLKYGYVDKQLIDETYSDYSAESKTIISMIYIDTRLSSFSAIYSSGLSASVILIAVSLMFIIQGMINKSEGKNVR